MALLVTPKSAARAKSGRTAISERIRRALAALGQQHGQRGFAHFGGTSRGKRVLVRAGAGSHRDCGQFEPGPFIRNSDLIDLEQSYNSTK
jgi:hypothetical protein